jgi:hypothetical protein
MKRHFELRRRGWKDAVIHLPHNGVATNNISGKRYVDHWREAGFECETPIKNTGVKQRALFTSVRCVLHPLAVCYITVTGRVLTGSNSSF